METIRSSFLTLIAALIILQSSEAMAWVYFFNVKVVNNSGQDIKIRRITAKAKTNLNIKECEKYDGGLLIPAGSSTVSPRCAVATQKWQRQIMVEFRCTSNGAVRNLYFPRGSNKFFARDHAQKNGDKYVTKIKAGDC